MRWRKSHDVPLEDEDPYWKSFVDIMSALLVLFILASVVLILQLMEKSEQFDQKVSQLEQAEKVRRTILDEAVEKLQQRGIKVEVSENHTVLRIPNELLGFDTGAFEIQPRYQETALETGPVINDVISRDNRVEYLDTIFIEGHTDNRPFPGFMGKGNWGLSTFRAISLWQFWSTELPEAERLNRLSNQDGEPLFSVSGYAETRPVSKQQVTEEDYRLNRRIDIRFTIRRPQSTEYEAVKSLLGSSGQ
ncbi:type VI secretion system peptidoglycan-associated domain protein [compost metagenome]